MSDEALLEAFRLQCEHAERNGFSAWGVMLMWRGQEGVAEDDLIDIAREVTAEVAGE
jgi:hypothetical protein